MLRFFASWIFKEERFRTFIC